MSECTSDGPILYAFACQTTCTKCMKLWPQVTFTPIYMYFYTMPIISTQRLHGLLIQLGMYTCIKAVVGQPAKGNDLALECVVKYDVHILRNVST